LMDRGEWRLCRTLCFDGFNHKINIRACSRFQFFPQLSAFSVRRQSGDMGFIQH